MSDSDENLKAYEALEQHVMLSQQDLDDPLKMLDRIYVLSWKWADFHLSIISPHIEHLNTPQIIEPAEITPGGKKEFVYTIYDYGDRFSLSKAEEMFSAGMSMCKLYFTIEKVVALLVERLNSAGVSTETEVQVAFAGHELAYRKAFEVIINLSYNVVVTNFDPGVWGERFLQNIKNMADKGMGYPPESPRDIYKRSYSQTGAPGKR